MISKRLLAISKFVPNNKVVFDVGTDHALLPCFLVENGISPKVYAGDVAIGPLNHAIETIKSHHLEGKVIPVLSNGLEKASNEVEVVTISGMGFHTIKVILDNKDLNKYERIIIEANKDNDLLREYLSNKHYTIIDETVVFDGFYYEIIVFNTNYHEIYNSDEIKYGPINLIKKEKEFINYLIFKRDKLININKNANKKEYQKQIESINKMLLKVKDVLDD